MSAAEIETDSIAPFKRDLLNAITMMRLHARAALGDDPEVQPITGRWKAEPTIDPDNHGWNVVYAIPEADWDTTVANLPYDYEGALAPHVATWTPAVALAIADWLEVVYEQLGTPGHREWHGPEAAAINAARTYLRGVR